MGWFQLAQVVLSVVNRILKFMNDRQLLKAGEQRQIAKQQAQMAVDAGVAAEVMEEIMNLSVEEVDEKLEDDFID